MARAASPHGPSIRSATAACVGSFLPGMSTVETASHACFAPHADPPERLRCRAPRSRTWRPPGRRRSPSCARGSAQQPARAGDDDDVAAEPVGARPPRASGLGVNQTDCAMVSRSSRGVRPRCFGQPGGARRARLLLGGPRVDAADVPGLGLQLEPADEVGLAPCACAGTRTGSVRPTTATAWPKDSRWHSPTRGVGPGSGGGGGLGRRWARSRPRATASVAAGSVGDDVQAADGEDERGQRGEDRPHPITRAASVPPSSYADSRSASPTSPSTSRTGAAWRQPSAPTIDCTDRTAPVVS